MSDWKHKDEWIRLGKNFAVRVVHWTRPTEDRELGPHKWNVYAHITKEHPLFDKLNAALGNRELLYGAVDDLPFHGGVTWYERERVPVSHWKLEQRDTVCGVCIGSDYAHLHDDRFSHYATRDDAREVFEDADALFAALSAAGEVQP